jgi:hypothetical protein
MPLTPDICTRKVGTISRLHAPQTLKFQSLGILDMSLAWKEKMIHTHLVVLF